MIGVHDETAPSGYRAACAFLGVAGRTVLMRDVRILGSAPRANPGAMLGSPSPIRSGSVRGFANGSTRSLASSRSVASSRLRASVSTSQYRDIENSRHVWCFRE